ncbi:ABC transporter B family member 19 [Acorus calamus]|uniref:ABC transporter B family member 19 n=1 Tax=Acorus calamus TaxID=4465 RepID=A0AAV9DU29_ACOCL|nr:ABC transporter B family member 19 [Acorus calamus]
MYSSERQLARLRLAFLGAILRQDISAFDTDLTPGKIITGITNHMSVIQDAIGEKVTEDLSPKTVFLQKLLHGPLKRFHSQRQLGHFISSFATFFVGIIIAFACCWEVALMFLVVVPLILAVGATYTKKMNTISARRMVYLSETTALVEQIKTVFAFVGEMTTIKSFSQCMEKQFNMSKKEALIKGIGLGMFQTITFSSWALIVWVGAVVVSAGKADGGNTIAAVMSILFGAISITYAAPDLQIFNQAKAAGYEVFQVIDRKPGINHEMKGKILDKVHGNIDLQNVYFSYPSREDKQILQGFSLSIPAGKVVALVGSSGCGKSTVISLIERFYDPSKGDIFIDNHSIKELDLKFLRKNIGVVSQEPSLFAGTVRDNLKVGNMDANDGMIENAASTANVHSFISNLPNGYSTEVGERGVQLSGGQKQRIAIARAILKNPPILLLDEATSALDSESEKLVQDALERVMQGRTVILIAHRMATVVNADIIALVEDGIVAETGTHHQLLETNKFYLNLFNMQNLTKEPEQRETNHIASPRSSTQASESIQSFEIKELDYELGEAHEQEIPKAKGKPVSFFRIWFRLNNLEIAKIILGSLAAALSGVSKPIFGFFIMTIGVAYYSADAKAQVGWYSMIFCLIGLLALATHILQHYFYGVVGEKSMRNLRESLFSAILRNEIAWFEKPENGVGFVTARIVNDTSMIKTTIADRMSVIVQCISSIMIATTVSMIVNWRMGLVAWAVMPCHFIGGLIQAKSAKGFSGDSTAAHQELVALASESVTNIRTVASFTHEEQILKKAKLSLRNPMKKSRAASIKYGIIQGISLCLWNIAHAVALWYTTVLVNKKQATFKNGIRSYQIFSLTVPSITELWTLIPTVITAISILTPAFETLDRKTEIEPDVPENSNPQRFRGRIEFDKVNFSYPLRPQVTILDSFCLKIEPGLTMALVGPSGAGKSSVIALLLRFYDPQRGRIMVDRKDIKEYNLRWLRSQIGLVQQEPILFSSSIRENISYGSEGASETEIIKASMEANIHEFISNLPNGYDTLVGEKGCQLSGGQKQRIAIARTILKNPVILLLDEATSALDGESENMVMSALGSMKLEKPGGSSTKITQIIVAHRLSTVKNSDIIVVMDKGQVVETGDHSTLIADGDGVYSRLVHLQSLIEV